MVHKRKVILALLFTSLIATSTLVTSTDVSVKASDGSFYSFVHLTDTQTLSQLYPETLNATFTYLESIKTQYNIKAIINTGDLVEDWNNTTEWQNYVAAKTLTTIPVFDIAGNHDNNLNYGEADFTYYNTYIGSDKQYYYTVFDDFIFLGISMLNTSNLMNQTVIDYFKSALNNYPDKFPVIGTHAYMDESKVLEGLGQQIIDNFVSKPTIVLCGHVIADIFNTRSVKGTSVYEFDTDYQGANQGYVRLFKVYTGSSIDKITFGTLRVFPYPTTWTTMETQFYVSSPPVPQTPPALWALSFDGSNDYVENVRGIPKSDQWTFTAWIKADSPAPSYMAIISQGGTTEREYLFEIWNDNTFRVHLGSSNYVWVNLGSLTVTNWNHVAFVISGASGVTNNVRAYINGALTHTGTATYKLETLVGNFKIGARQDFAGEWMKGVIDEVRVYNRALTGAEVLAHYNSGFGQYGFPESGLAAGWHFDEGSGTVANDYSGNNNQGTIYGATWVPGKVPPPGVPTATGTGNATFATDAGYIEGLVAVNEATLPTTGKPNVVFPHGFFEFRVGGLAIPQPPPALWALSFDGSSGYVSVGSGAAVSQVTVEAWINSAQFVSNWRYEIISKEKQLLGPNYEFWGYRMYIDTDGVGGKILTFRFGDGNTDGKIVRVAYPFLTNTWYHVVGSFDGTNNGVGSPIYVNGVRQTTTESGTSLSGNSITYSTGATLRIGARSPESDPVYGTSVYDWWNGTIDEVRVYNRALTGAEVLAHYNSGFGQYGFPESGLAAGWHFDEGSGTVANDYSGNNNQGTIYGATWVPGKVPPPGVPPPTGQTITVTITLPSAVPVGTRWYKYDGSVGWISLPIGSDDGDNVITLSLTDNGKGDFDPAYEVILDPGGPGIPPTLHIDPQLSAKTPSDVGASFRVNVTVTGVTDLFGFDINITWDNALITFQEDYYSQALDALWGSGNWYVAKNATDGGSYKLAAVSTASDFNGSGTLFTLEFHVERGCNFPLQTPIHFQAVKLSDHLGNSIVANLIDGQYQMSATVPDLEFVLVDASPSKPFEYCKTFDVAVYVTHICAHLTDYNLTVNYNSELLKFIGVGQWGVLGAGHNSSTSPGIVNVWSDPSSTPYVGDRGLLFNLTFHVEFDDRIGHVWRTSNSGPLAAQISLDATTGDLGFQEGTISVSGVTTTSTSLTLTINLIQGDVTCDGRVNIQDLRTVAYYYDQTVPPAPAKYDVKTDSKIDIFDLVLVAAKFGYPY